ncbi:MAG TPA: hypothetical protein VNT01_09780 [Symbiobacteriaceae bacterium]|nr:hypothetical protein [Symbiobacteriaceae bacterium]
MPVDFVARWLSFLGRLILISAHAEDANDDEKTFLSLRVGLVTMIGVLFVLPTIIRVVPGSEVLLQGSPNAESVIPSLMPLALLLGLAFSLIGVLGFLYNVRACYPLGVWLLPVSFGILLEFVWKSFPNLLSERNNLPSWGAVALVLLVLPLFYPAAAMRENRLNLAVHATFRLLRDPLFGFAAMACLLGWAFWIPYTAMTQGTPYTQVQWWILPLQSIPKMAPLLAVWIYGRRHAAGAGLRRIRQDLAVWRVPVVYYLWALFLPILLWRVVLALLGRPFAVPWYVYVYGICLSALWGISRAIVWRGYMLNQCLRRWSPLTATLAVGAVEVVFFQVMQMTNANFSTSFTLLTAPMLIAFGIQLAGFYHRTGSLLLTILLQGTLELTYLAITMILLPGAAHWYVFILISAFLPALAVLYLERVWFFGKEHRPTVPVEKVG